MKRGIVGALAVTAIAGASLFATSTAAMAAQPPGCKLDWHDANTAAVKCTRGSFIGGAKCKNGQVVSGAQAAAGTTSYAYCTSVNSSLASPIVWSAIYV